MVRIFMVDDSAFVRRALSRVLDAQPGCRVVGEASSGLEALEKIPSLDPDLVTLDVEMPGMDGLEVLRGLLRWKPRLKVLMLSAHTRRGAEITVEALAAGAVDFIDKSSFNVMDLESLRRVVVEKIAVWGTTRTPPAATALPAGAAPSQPAPDPETLARCELCVIGASTGGPAALQRIMERIFPSFPMPIVVVQHMPPGFTKPFAQRLDGLSRVPVAEAVDGERLTAGQVRIAPAGTQLRISANLAVLLSGEPANAKHVPSIDIAMKSAARACPGRVLGILLTGMGDDGADGMVAIRAGGGLTIAESEASCVVYGMPRAALARGGAACVLSLSEIAGLLERLKEGFPSTSEGRR